MDDNSIFRQKGAGVPRGVESTAEDAVVSNRSGGTSEIPVWKSFVTNSEAAKRFAPAVSVERDLIRQAGSGGGERWGGDNGRLFRKVGRQIEEHDAEAFAEDPVAGPFARKSLWDRERRRAGAEFDEYGLKLEDPAFRARELPSALRKEREMELEVLPDGDARKEAARKAIADDDAVRAERAEIERRRYEAKVRSTRLANYTPDEWWANRGAVERPDPVAGAVAARSEADAAYDSALEEEKALDAELMTGVRANRLAEIQARKAEIARAREMAGEQRVEAADVVEGARQEAEKKKDFFRAGDTISGIWDAVKGLGVTAPAAFYQLVEGLDRPDQYSESAKRAFAEAQAWNEEMQAKTAANQAAGTSSSVGESFREAGGSLGFSLGSMAAAIPASMAGAKVGAVTGGAIGAAAGAPAAGVGAAPGAGLGATIGATVGGVSAGMAASGTAAYRMAGAAFLNEAFQTIEAESMRKNSRPMNEEEKASAYAALLPIAKNTALWEAGPEAVGNAVTLGAGKIIFGLGKPLLAKFAKTTGGKVALKTGAGAASIGTELATETLTQVEQGADQQKMMEIAAGRDPDVISADWSAGGVVDAFKEIAPQTLALMAMMGGAGGAIKGVAMGIEKLRPNAPQEEVEQALPQVNTALAAIDPELPPATPEEIRRATMIASGDAEGLAEAVLIERELASVSAEDDAALASAKEALEAAKATLDTEVIKAAEEAVAGVQGRAEGVRAVLKIAAGQDPGALTGAELRSLGLKRDAKGSIGPMSDADLAKAGLNDTLVTVGDDGSLVLTDEALKRAEAVSSRARGRVKMTEAEALAKARERANRPTWSVGTRGGTAVEVQAATAEEAEREVAGRGITIRPGSAIQVSSPPAGGTGVTPGGGATGAGAAGTDSDEKSQPQQKTGAPADQAGTQGNEGGNAGGAESAAGQPGETSGRALTIQNQKRFAEEDTSIEAKVNHAINNYEDSGDRWNALRQSGATDEQIAQEISRQFGHHGSSVHGGYMAKGTSLTEEGDGSGNKPRTIKGKELIAMVRKLTGIALPQNQTSTPAAPPTPGAAALKAARARINKLTKQSPELAAAITESGTLGEATATRIAINPEEIIAEAIGAGMTDAQALARFNAILDEEIKHMGQRRAAIKKWESLGQPGDYQSWYQSYYGGRWKTEFVDTGKADVSRTLYAKGDPATEARWDAMPDADKFMETTRMMMQRRDGTVTEQTKLWANISKALIEDLRAMLRELRAMVKGIDMTPALKADIEFFENELRTILENQPRGGTPKAGGQKPNQSPQGAGSGSTSGRSEGSASDGRTDTGGRDGAGASLSIGARVTFEAHDGRPAGEGRVRVFSERMVSIFPDYDPNESFLWPRDKVSVVDLNAANKPKAEDSGANPRDRNQFPGEDYAVPANTVAIQPRGLNTEPMGDQVFTYEYDGTAEDAARVGARAYMELQQRFPEMSQRESIFIAADEDGMTKFRLQMDQVHDKVRVFGRDGKRIEGLPAPQDTADPANPPQESDIEKFTNAYSGYHLARVAREEKENKGNHSADYWQIQRDAWAPGRLRDRVADFLKAIDGKDVVKLVGYNNGMFNGFWKLFGLRTKIKVPSSQREKATMIRDYVGAEAYDDFQSKVESARTKQEAEQAAKDEEYRINGLKADAARIKFEGGITGDEWVDAQLADGWRVVNVSSGPIPRYVFRKGNLEKGFGDKKQVKPLIAYAREKQKGMEEITAAEEPASPEAEALFVTPASTEKEIRELLEQGKPAQVGGTGGVTLAIEDSQTGGWVLKVTRDGSTTTTGRPYPPGAGWSKSEAILAALKEANIEANDQFNAGQAAAKPAGKWTYDEVKSILTDGSQPVEGLRVELVSKPGGYSVSLYATGDKFFPTAQFESNKNRIGAIEDLSGRVVSYLNDHAAKVVPTATPTLSPAEQKAANVLKGLFASPLPVARHAELEAKHNAGTITDAEVKEAEALVAKAAKAAGFKFGPLVHGGIEKPDGKFPKDAWHYFSNNEGIAAEFASYGDGTVIKAFLKLNNPAVYNLDKLSMKERWELIPQEDRKYLNEDDIKSPMGLLDNAELDAIAEKSGHDGVIVEMPSAGRQRGWLGSMNKEDIYVVFSPSQIKSAEPFTGVPLDQRFDDTSDSILRASPLPPRTYTTPIPQDRFMALMEAAQALVGEGVDTPAKLAETMKKLAPDDKALPYTQSFWFALKAVGAQGPAEPDWAGVYGVMGGNTTDQAEKPQAQPPALRLAQQLAERIKRKEKTTIQQLTQMATEIYGGRTGENFDIKTAYDAVEMAINLLIMESGMSVNATPEQARQNLETIRGWLEYIPTQTRRTGEMDALQQFSTPPHFSYIASWVAAVTPNDVGLEPSSGLGGLAAWMKRAGARVLLNELSPRRREMLDAMKIGDPATGHDAGVLHSLMLPSITSGATPRPTVVVMNPPFSNNAAGRKDLLTGGKHIEEALKLLPPGGRLVAIVGEGMAIDAPRYKPWWDKIRRNHSVRANIHVDGREYAKYGTTFSNRILVIDKAPPTGESIVGGEVTRIEDLIPLLDGIRTTRPTPNASDLSSSPPASDQQGGNASDQEGGDDTSDVSRPPGSGARPASSNQGGAGGVRGGNRPNDGGSNNGASDTSTGASTDTGANPDGAAEGNSGQDTRGTGAKLDNEVERETAASEREVDADQIFSDYTPTKFRLKGAKPHPNTLVESSVMASTELPDSTATVNLPKETVEKGELSDAQIEAVAYAAQAHESVFENGDRQGFFIGDGTGVGKGREIAGTILHNWREGRKRAVWISEKSDLVKDARRDFDGIGGKEIPLHDMAKNTGAPQGDAVAFLTYDGLKGNFNGIDADGNIRRVKQNKTARMQELVNWLGKDFDGVIALDEAHNAGNALAIRGTRGVKQPSKKALAVVDLQALFPKARILYVSATGATEPNNLAFASRLGLWGPGKAFRDAARFFNEISSAGISAMEIVARDLKALGLYIARTLSFKGVSFRRVEHNLTLDQVEIYDKAAEGWQTVFANLDEALAITGATNSSLARSAAASAFWGSQQRFFNGLLTALQMPTALADMRQKIADGGSVVIQLINTNEAALDRAINRALDENPDNPDYESVDMSSRQDLLDYIYTSFPTAQFHEIPDGTDADGNPKTKWVPLAVEDENGVRTPVENPEAVAMRDDLIEQIALLRLPDPPLEQIINAFGVDAVAEITGRSRRLVTRTDDRGITRRVLEPRSKAHNNRDKNDFLDGKRRVLIFSDAGGTGFSYHAGANFKNQQKRYQYVVQAGWRADKAIQGLGRTHRADQVLPPEFILVSTNVSGHKRFISTIARRLQQLGALTSGERKTTGQGLFTESDNLEDRYAESAVGRFFIDLFRGNVEGLNFDDLTRRMGYQKRQIDEVTGEVTFKNKLLDDVGQLNMSEIPELKQFLNRMLALPLADQSTVFDAFVERRNLFVEQAKAAGSYDAGVETLQADEAEIVNDEVVYEDPNSSSATRLVEVGFKRYFDFNDFEYVRSVARKPRYVVSRDGKRIYALGQTDQSITHEDGRVLQAYRRYTLKGASLEAQDKYEIGKRPGKAKVGDQFDALGEQWELIEIDSENGKARIRQVGTEREKQAGAAYELKYLFDQTGNVVEGVNDNSHYVPAYFELSESEAAAAWGEALEQEPKYEDKSATLIVGSTLPVWHRIPFGFKQVKRVNLANGDSFLGMIVPDDKVEDTRSRLGASAAEITPGKAVSAIMDRNAQVELSNGWRMKRTLSAGEVRIEVVGPDPRQWATGTSPEWNRYGFVERIGFTPRMFMLPNLDAVDRLLRYAPAIRMIEVGLQAAPLPPRASKQIERLQKVIDLKYESGKTKGVEDLEARLETLLENADTTIDGMDEADGVGAFGPSPDQDAGYPHPEADLVSAWYRWTGKGQINARDMADFRKEYGTFANFYRDTLGDGAYMIQSGISDAQIIEAAKDAVASYERRRSSMKGLQASPLRAAPLPRANSAEWKAMSKEERMKALRAKKSQPRTRPVGDMPSIQTTDGRTLQGPGLFEIGGLHAAPLPAWHGTPHKVGRFSLDKIGTGEGAQAYGWGLYFAENRNVAELYKNKLATTSRAHVKVDGKRMTSQTARKTWEEHPDRDVRLSANEMSRHLTSIHLPAKIADRINYHRNVLTQMEERLAERIAPENSGTIYSWTPEMYQDRIDSEKSAIARLSKFSALVESVPEKKNANLYRVELDVEQDELLDWDKPLTQQPKKAMASFRYMQKKLADSITKRRQEMGNPSLEPLEEKPFSGWYGNMVEMLGGARQASEYLRDLGIRGIRYLDGNSRGGGKLAYQEGLPTGWAYYKTKAGWGIKDAKGLIQTDVGATKEAAHRNLFGEKPSYNYVIFDESAIRITEENGTPVDVGTALRASPLPSISRSGMRYPEFRLSQFGPVPSLTSNTGVLYPDGHEIDLSQNQAPAQIPDGGGEFWNQLSKDGRHAAVLGAWKAYEGRGLAEDWIRPALIKPGANPTDTSVTGFWSWLRDTLNSEFFRGIDPVDTMDLLVDIFQLEWYASERDSGFDQHHYMQIAPDGTVLALRNDNGQARFARLPDPNAQPELAFSIEQATSARHAELGAKLRAAPLPPTRQRARDSFERNRAKFEEAQAQVREFGNSTAGADPKFANPGSTPAARDQFDIARMIDSAQREVRKDRDTFSRGREYLEKYPDEVERLLMERAYGENAEPIADYQQHAINLLLDRKAQEAGGDKAKLEDLYMLATANIINGREMARAFRMRMDRFATPEERAQSAIYDAIFTPNKRIAARAEVMAPKARKEFLAEEGKKRIEAVEKELRKLGVRLEQVIGKNQDLQLKNSRLEKDMLQLRNALEQDIIRFVQKGASMADIRRRFGKLGSEQAADIIAKARQDLFDRIKEMAAKGMNRQAILDAMRDTLKAAPLNSPAGGITDAEIWAMIDKDFGIPAEIPKNPLPRIKKPKVEKAVEVHPLSANWSRPEFSDYMRKVVFDTKDRAGIMERVEIIRGLAGAMGKINELSGAKRQQAGAMLDEINGILAKYGTDAQGIFESSQGIEDYGFDISDIAQVAAVSRAINALDADVIDKATEYLYFSMLSGMQTMLVNATAILPAAWESTVGRGVNMAINRFVKDPMAEQYGEGKYIIRALAPGIKRAMSNFTASMAAQHPMFDRDVNAMEIDWDKILGGGSHRMIGSISGKKGDLIRLPMRLLTATDDFNRTLIAMAEVGTFAYRMAKMKGMKDGSPEMDKFILAEVNTPGSLSFQLASQKASRAIYTNPLPGQPDPHTGKSVPVRDMGDFVGFLAGKLTSAVAADHDNIFIKAMGSAMRVAFFPFQRTPFNIIRKGIRHTLNPFSLVDILIGVARNARNEQGKWEWAIKGNDQAAFQRHVQRAELIERAGQQLQGAVLMAALYALAWGEGDEDDQEKRLVITGSMPFLPTGRSERDAKMRSGLGPFRVSWRNKDGSERIGFSYGRIEPVATILAATIDTMKSAKRALRSDKDGYDAVMAAMGGLVSQAQDKTFMRGIGDFIALASSVAAEPDLRENRKALQFLAGRTAMVVPNIIKQPIRESDNQFRERSESFMQELLYQSFPAGQKPAKMDPYGQTLQKPGVNPLRAVDLTDTGRDPVNPYDRALMVWSDKNPDKAWFPSPIMNGKIGDTDMTAAQLAEFRDIAGKRVLARLKREPINLANPTEIDINIMRKAHSEARSEARRMLAIKYSR